MEDEYGKLSEEKLREAIDYVFNQKRVEKQERQFKLMSYCKGIDGPKEYGTNMTGLCDHPECVQCRNFENAFKEEVDRQIKMFDVKLPYTGKIYKDDEL